MSRIIETPDQYNDQVVNTGDIVLDCKQNNVVDADELQALKARAAAHRRALELARQSPIMEV